MPLPPLSENLFPASCWVYCPATWSRLTAPRAPFAAVLALSDSE